MRHFPHCPTRRRGTMPKRTAAESGLSELPAKHVTMSPGHLARMPRDVVGVITSFLTLGDACRLARTCKYLYRGVMDAPSVAVKPGDRDTILFDIITNPSRHQWLHKVINGDVDLEKRGWTGRTALTMAVCRGHGPVVQQLIAAGANVNAIDNVGDTALTMAACRGHGPVVQQLIAAGANVNAIDNDGNTALTVAACRGHDSCVQKLIATGANVEAVNRFRTTPLINAARKGHNSCVRQMIALCTRE